MQTEDPAHLDVGTHQAMATNWEVRVAGAKAAYAAAAVAAAWREIGAVEAEPSRFVEGSDIDRVARAAAGVPSPSAASG